MSISAQEVSRLREKTGAGMMDCKKALQETSGDFEKAIDFLKQQGLAKAVKKGDRIAAEGLIFSNVQGNVGVVAELNCETDFVSRNADFIKLGNDLVDAIIKNKPATVDQTLTLKMGQGSAQEHINQNIVVIGEKLSLRRFQLMTPKKGGQIVLYSHAGGRIAVLVEVTGSKVSSDVCKDVAMQIAAMCPLYVDKSEVSQDVLNREKAIYLEQMKDSGKPAAILEKILVGKLDKFAGEMSLLQQIFVKDTTGKKTVAQYLKESDPQASVAQFVRYAVGEGIEKRKDDFADEVKRMAS